MIIWSYYHIHENEWCVSINGISSLHEVAHFFSQYYNLIILQLQYEEVRSRTVYYKRMLKRQVFDDCHQQFWYQRHSIAYDDSCYGTVGTFYACGSGGSNDVRACVFTVTSAPDWRRTLSKECTVPPTRLPWTLFAFERPRPVKERAISQCTLE